MFTFSILPHRAKKKEGLFLLSTTGKFKLHKAAKIPIGGNAGIF
jgi:hypothetical protein